MILADLFAIFASDGGKTFLLLAALAGLTVMFLRYLMKSSENTEALVKQLGEQFMSIHRQQHILFEQQTAILKFSQEREKECRERQEKNESRINELEEELAERQLIERRKREESSQ